MRMKLTALIPVLLLGACAAPEHVPTAVPETPSPAQVAAARPQAKVQKPGPIPVRPLNVKTECSFRDETGYNGALKLDVAEARVNAFEAKVNIPKRGSCRFNLKDFRQTKELPAIELSQNKGACIVRMWEQGSRVTVAFQQCERMCSGNAYISLWPILNDRRDGSCA
jgi:hypothetical protein